MNEFNNQGDLVVQNQQTPEDFKPQNELEQLLVKVKAGVLPLKELLRQLLSSGLFVATINEVGPDGSGFLPLLFERDRVPLAAAFTAISRVSAQADRAKYCVRMNGAEFLKRVPEGYGVTINPGFSATFEISPTGIKDILRDFGDE
jgi:hypothetical protein